MHFNATGAHGDARRGRVGPRRRTVLKSRLRHFLGGGTAEPSKGRFFTTRRVKSSCPRGHDEPEKPP
jgi:hypothetical protein